MDIYNNPSESDKEKNVSFWAIATPIIWDGVNFSGTRVDTATVGTTATQTIKGSVSPEGNTVLTVTCQLQADSDSQHTSVTVVLQNIPLKYVNGILDKSVLTSSSVQQYIVSLEYNVTHTDSGSVYASSTYISPVWTNDANIEVIFRKTQNP